MNFTRHLLVVLFLIGGTAASAAKDLVVINFAYMPRNTDGTHQRSYEFAFGDWEKTKNVFARPEKGLIVNLVGSKGGVGENRGLDFRKHSLARVTFVIGIRNQAESCGFSLVDTDGTDQNWEIPLKDKKKDSVLTVLLDLTKPSREDKPGKTTGLNLKKLKSWQIKGNYQDAPIEVMFIKVTAVSE